MSSASRECNLKFPSHSLKKWETGEINFNDTFYILYKARAKYYFSV